MTARERFQNKVDNSGGPSACHLWKGGKDGGGYGRFWYKGKMVKATRFIWEDVHGSIPHGLCVCHTCDNRECVNLKHLWLGTQSENMKDCSEKGRHARVGFKPRSLSVRQEKEVKTQYASGGISQRRLAEKFNVSQATIWATIHERYYS